MIKISIPFDGSFFFSQCTQFVLNAYSYGKWVHEPEKVAGFANLFDGLPEHSNYDNDLYNANNKTWKQFTLTWLEKIRIKPEQKGACQYLEVYIGPAFSDFANLL